MSTEEMLKKATGRPWETFHREDGQIFVTTDEGCTIATFHGDESDPDDWPSISNAALAVRAVNSFEAMREALKITAGNIRSLGPAGAFDGLEPGDEPPKPYRAYEVWLDVVEKALAGGAQ